MSVSIDKSGYFEITYKDFTSGLNVQQPESEIPDTATPDANNFQIRNKELRSRPPFSLKYPGMDRLSSILGSFSFNDANGVTHSVAWNVNGLWQLAPAGVPFGSAFPWAPLQGPILATGNPVSYKCFANTLYYTNGSPWLASWDGIASAALSSNTFGDASVASSVAGVSKTDAPTVVSGTTGPLAIGALFLGELDNHLLLANVVVLDQLGVNSTQSGTLLTFPQRLWWSANGIPNQWDFAANTNAGENDFLDVPDSITGLAFVGVQGYIFRTNGITFFTPTGNGAAPFQFDHLWASEHGIGNVYPWSIHSYGAIVCFISTEEIYQMGVSSFEPIGGTARDAIFADLAQTTGNPLASIVPTENLGYVYLTYRISIPLGNFTRHYIYSIQEKNWMPWDTPGFIQTGRCEEIWSGILSSLPMGAQPPGTATQGGTGGGSGTGGGGGGTGGGGGRPPITCFTGETRIKTPYGWRMFFELPETFEILNENGKFWADLVVHDNVEEDVIRMEKGRVNLIHLLKFEGKWQPAGNIFSRTRREKFKGTLYNLHVRSDKEEDKHYVLESGWLAHNVKP